ncbi:MAG: v-SNARE N-terminal domain-containing protein [Planctomycetota bacterium]|jgi:hypothetical protein
MLVRVLQDLSIPKDKDAIFVTPQAWRWPSLLAANKLVLGGLPGRRDARMELLEMARSYTVNDLSVGCRDSLVEDIIGGGHQANWRHCGVWVKDVMTGRLAGAVNGAGLHIVIDHDISDTGLLLPKQGDDGRWSFERIELETRQPAVPLEFRRLSGPADLNTFVKAVTDLAPDGLCSEIWPKYPAADNNAVLRSYKVADVITYLQSGLNAALGLDMIYLPVSRLSESDGFCRFVVSVVKDAAEFAAGYNAAITKWRQERGTKPGQRIRLLEVDRRNGSIELPFWLIPPDGKRTSLYVSRQSSGKVRFGTSFKELAAFDWGFEGGQLRDTLRKTGWRLRPKAVSLTLFVRLFLLDWFVHGVGGARYEYVTDYVLEHYYGMKGLNFGVATVTATLPGLIGADRGKGPLAQLRRQRWYVKHNPERLIEGPLRDKAPVKSLIAAKKRLVQSANDQSLPGEARRSARVSISEVNRKLLQLAGSVVDKLDEEIELAERCALSNRVRDYREFFFGLFPREDLCKMANLPVFAES